MIIRPLQHLKQSHTPVPDILVDAIWETSATLALATYRNSCFDGLVDRVLSMFISFDTPKLMRYGLQRPLAFIEHSNLWDASRMGMYLKTTGTRGGPSEIDGTIKSDVIQTMHEERTVQDDIITRKDTFIASACANLEILRASLNVRIRSRTLRMGTWKRGIEAYVRTIQQMDILSVTFREWCKEGGGGVETEDEDESRKRSLKKPYNTTQIFLSIPKLWLQSPSVIDHRYSLKPLSHSLWRPLAFLAHSNLSPGWDASRMGMCLKTTGARKGPSEIDG
ncbi:hypothetical protein F5880DRAFT_1510896 [Lentinula raphanica]|nr:hypothetical protein F5880DRAFT_1510896 [Lentinula raphanica]